MRKVELRMNEEFKYEVIKKLVDTDGNKKNAAIKLGCTQRTVNRLVQLYKIEGKEGFIHKNRGKVPSTTIPFAMKERITSNYVDNYLDTNFRHYSEIVLEEFGVKVSDTTLNQWMRELMVLSPKARRKTKHDLRTHIKALEKTATSKAKVAELRCLSETIDDRFAHPRRPRCQYKGEMIQMDASSFEWIPGVVWHLHVAIDDATGLVVGAWFDHQETLNGYYHVFHQILSNYGIPCMFYTDRRTVFEYKRKNTLFDDEDTFTQFSYACHQLGVEIKTSSVPQAKGRVERLNQTLQSRLPVELRRSSIKSIEEANAFLSLYLTKFNDKFSIPINSSKNVFEKQPSDTQMNLILAKLSTRKIDTAHCIKFKQHYYIPTDNYGRRQYFTNKTECLMIESYDENLYVTIHDKVYLLEMIEDYEEHSKNFGTVSIPKESKKKYIPKMSHPWKAKSFQIFQAKQKHRENIGANV